MAANDTASRYVLRFIGAGGGLVALRALLAPRTQMADMLTPAAMEEVERAHPKVVTVLELLTRWCGLFFAGLCTTTLWVAEQEPSSQMRRLTRALGYVWLVDALVVKGCFSRSRLVKAKDAQVALVVDFLVGLVHLRLSNNMAHYQ